MAINKIEATLKGALKQAIIACGFVEEYDQESITIEIPKDKSHGDYSINLAMQLTKLLIAIIALLSSNHYILIKLPLNPHEVNVFITMVQIILRLLLATL